MDLKEVKRIINMVEEANISSLAIEIEGIKIEIKKEFGAAQTFVAPITAHPQAVHPAPAAPATTAKVEDKKPVVDAKLMTIKSPMVGTVYLTPKPQSPSYTKLGDGVKVGQVVCMIEAMKLFNEIESEYSGKIEKILVENASPVEYGQELFLVRVE